MPGGSPARASTCWKPSRCRVTARIGRRRTVWSRRTSRGRRASPARGCWARWSGISAPSCLANRATACFERVYNLTFPADFLPAGFFWWHFSARCFASKQSHDYIKRKNIKKYNQKTLTNGWTCVIIGASKSEERRNTGAKRRHIPTEKAIAAFKT